jgi:hypothetical protein
MWERGLTTEAARAAWKLQAHWDLEDQRWEGWVRCGVMRKERRCSLHCGLDI